MAGPGGSSKRLYLLLAYGAVIAVLVLAYWHHSWNFDFSLSALLVTGAYPVDIGPKEPGIVQPIQFPHEHHVKDVGIECTFCHKTATSEDFATIPNVDTCMLCHTQPQTDSQEEEKIRRYAARNETIPWKRVYSVPQDVYFSHRRHVVGGGVKCTRCHGPMDEQEVPPPRPLNEFTMEFCLDCHVDRGQTQDCLICHR